MFRLFLVAVLLVNVFSFTSKVITYNNNNNNNNTYHTPIIYYHIPMIIYHTLNLKLRLIIITIIKGNEIT